MTNLFAWRRNSEDFVPGGISMAKQVTAAENRKLRAKIQRMKAFLRNAADLVSKAAQKYGKTVKCETHSSNIHVIKELEFGLFKFRSEHGETMMGGNTVSVWYHYFPVLEFYWQTDIEKAEVKTFDKSVKWEKPFWALLRDPEKIAKQIKKDKKPIGDARKSAKQSKLNEEYESLAAIAARLQVE